MTLSNRTMLKKQLRGIEPLEPRLALSAMGLNDTPNSPSGGLDDKIVYIHAGHGYTWDNSTWKFQRDEVITGVGDTEMIEDLGNQDQMTLLADYLFRAGATIVPLRPIGNQPNEVVLDNDDAGVTFTGSWSNSTAGIFYGDAGDIPYRYASTSSTETAIARYQPDLSEAGFYPVYAWTRYGSDRAADQLYRVHHAEGETEVTVNHRRVGNGLIYLGTYYFEAGTGGYVEISNKSSETGRVVIADMIRFGNGMGDIDRGGGVSGRAREDEAGLYWVEWHVDRSQGIPESEYRATSNDRSATVSLAPRYAEYMNRESDGVLADRVFVSFHSNAGGGNARGVLGLYNGNNNPATATPNQFLLAKTVAQEVNDDLVALNGTFEHNWDNNGTNVTLDRGDIEFGEINNLRIDDEFDATIIETGYHDNLQDIQMLRDPKVRDAIARATYQGIIKYFRSVDGNQTPATAAPAQVTGVWADSSSPGTATVHWVAPASSDALGGVATAYTVYASTNGYSFDGGVQVAGGGTTSHTFTGLDPDETYYFKVVAENTGGASPGSQVVAVRPTASVENVLIVNGFDRLSRSLNPTQPSPQSTSVQRVRPRESNSGDYVITVAGAIQRQASALGVASASNEAVIAGDVDLADYDAVVWMSGEESSADDTFNTTEQTLVSQYLAGGGNLFASGAEIGWDLDHLNNGRSFFRNTLKAAYAADDANTYTAAGSAGGILEGLDLSFDDGQQFYDVNYADVLSTNGGSTIIATYAGGGGAATYAQGTGGGGDVALLGLPVESILSSEDRDQVVKRILDAFDLSTTAAPANADFNGDGTVDLADFTVYRDAQGRSVAPGTSADADGNGFVDAGDYQIWRMQFGTTPASLAVAPLATGVAAANTSVEDSGAVALQAVAFEVALNDLSGRSRSMPRRAFDQQSGDSNNAYLPPSNRPAEQRLVEVQVRQDSWPTPPGVRLSAIDVAIEGDTTGKLNAETDPQDVKAAVEEYFAHFE